MRWETINWDGAGAFYFNPRGVVRRRRPISHQQPVPKGGLLQIESDMHSAIKLSIAVCLLGTTVAQAQIALPPAPRRHVTTISAGNKSGSEPSIAVNPHNSNQVVAAFQPATIAYSTDSGQTFATADLPPVKGWRTGGDESVTFDDKGYAYLGSLHFDKSGSPSYWAHGAGRNGIFAPLARRREDLGEGCYNGEGFSG